jgi:prolyl-tRNA synthetase
MFTGANADDRHLQGVDVARDITVRVWADLREVVAGQACSQCGKLLEVQQTIEVGHIFKLGYKYADALGVNVLDVAGNRTRVIMGCYGIGVERAMAAVVESHHDDKGIVWPVSVAPFHVAVVVAQSDDDNAAKVGEEIYEKLLAAGIEVIIDDRSERAGVKFRDVELTGIPYRITIGKRGLAERVIEWTTRSTGETAKVPIANVVHHVQSVLASVS